MEVMTIITTVQHHYYQHKYSFRSGRRRIIFNYKAYIILTYKDKEIEHFDSGMQLLSIITWDIIRLKVKRWNKKRCSLTTAVRKQYIPLKFLM